MGRIQPNIAHLRYRPDIDGLRALAIAAVVLYHCRFGVFAGGFVGVDVFFVISGYLIAALIHAPMQEGKFSFLAFWERRIRRIFPMLAVMLAATTAAALFLLFPADLKRYAASLAAAAAFVSNFQFFGEAGYFDVDAAQKPILHTWSLGAEAQFYLVFPPILYAFRKLDRSRLLQLLGAIAVASFVLSLWAVRDAPAFAFYLLPARMWELLLGVMLAIAAPAPVKQAGLANGLAVAGLGLIGWSVFTLSSDTPFPGAAALAPCLGTALTIYAGLSPAATVNRLLGAKPIAFVGVISYSLYLWHWPVLALARYYAFGELTVLQTGAAVVFCLLLSVLSWRYIEQPMLRRTWLPSRQSLMRLSGAATVLLLLAGGAVVFADGVPGRFPLPIRDMLAVSEERPEGLALCFNPNLGAIRAGRICHIGSMGSGDPTFLLWGDSHAEAVAPAIADAAARHQRRGLYVARGSCPPFLGVTSSRGTGCRDFADAVVRLALASEIDQVVIAAYWADYAEGSSYAPGGGHVLLDEDGTPGSLATNRAVFLDGLERTVKTLSAAHIKVVLVGPVPEVGWPVPETLARIAVRGNARDIRTPRAAYLTRSAFVLKAFDTMHEKYGVDVLRPDALLCPSDTCDVARDGHPLYRDTHHLSTFGANQIEPIFDPEFR